MPIARWLFDEDLKDSIGEMHGHAVSNPSLEGGAVHFDQVLT